jgi:hypothetical protein
MMEGFRTTGLILTPFLTMSLHLHQKQGNAMVKTKLLAHLASNKRIICKETAAKKRERNSDGDSSSSDSQDGSDSITEPCDGAPTITDNCFQRY